MNPVARFLVAAAEHSTFSIQLHFEGKQQLPLDFRQIRIWELRVTLPAHKAGRGVSGGNLDK